MRPRSVEELLSRAAEQERDAASRYRSVAQLAAARGEGAAAETAEALSAEAEQRAHALLAREIGPSRPRSPTGEGSSTLPPEMAERWHALATSADLTPYRLFAHAVACIDSAFAACVYAASAARSEELRAAAEELGREELDRAARLRQERRRAFHGQGSSVSLASLEAHEIHREVHVRSSELTRLLQSLAVRCRELGHERHSALLLSLLPSRLAADASLTPIDVASADDALHRALQALQATAETLEKLAASTSDESVLASAIAGLENIVGAIARVTQRLEDEEAGHGRRPELARGDAPERPISPHAS